MATYDNSYAIKITPNTPTLRGLTTTYSNDGKEDLHGIGLGDLYGLDYDRDKIESIFNNATDKKYEVMKRENEIAQNQYANNQFANQQSAIESLRAQRNEQIASGMARGLNAAQEQGTILGVQQESAAGALELANKQQLAADQIAAEYAENVIKALQEANSVKQAMANVSSALYEADMMGYTGELNAAAQMDKNASDRYGSELGAEATRYAADVQAAAARAQAAATIAAANISAKTQKELAAAQTQGVDINELVKKYADDPTKLKSELMANGVNATDQDAKNMSNNYYAQQIGYANYADLKSAIDKKYWASAGSTDKMAQNLITKAKNGEDISKVNAYDLGYNLGDAISGIMPWSWGNTYK